MASTNFEDEVNEIISNFSAIETVKSDISIFLEDTRNSPDDTIKHYLACHMLIIFCGEMERKIKALIRLYNQNISQKNLAKFLSRGKTAKQLMRVVNKENLSSTFDGIENRGIEERHLVAYASCVNNRNKLAHEGTNDLTWHDLKEMEIDLVAKEIISGLKQYFDE